MQTYIYAWKIRIKKEIRPSRAYMKPPRTPNVPAITIVGPLMGRPKVVLVNKLRVVNVDIYIYVYSKEGNLPP